MKKLDYHKEYYEKNKDSILLKQKAYREQDIEKERQRCRDYYERNRESLLERCRAKYHETKNAKKEE